MEGAFAQWLPHFEITPSLGGASAWIKGPSGLNCQELARQCAARGILIEPGDVFFSKPSSAAQSFFRMGYSAIATSQIKPGMEEFAKVCKAMGFGAGDGAGSST